MGGVKDVKLPVRMGFVETRCDADQISDADDQTDGPRDPQFQGIVGGLA